MEVSKTNKIPIITVGLLLLVIITVASASATPGPMRKLEHNITYLDISTYDSSNQLTHPSVIYTATGWNGYHYLMAMTPYPAGNDDYENPSMRYSNDTFTWEKIAGQPDPIIPEPPSPAHYSDPNLVLNGSKLHMFYRLTKNENTPTEYSWVYYTTSTDGVSWTTPVQTNLDQIISPSFIYNGTGWEAWGHVRVSENDIPIIHYVSSDVTTWTATGPISFNFGDYTPWHSEIKFYDNQFQMLLTPTSHDALYYYNSTNGLTWVGSEDNPVMKGFAGHWDQKLYKSTFYEHNNIFDVWYTGWTDSPIVWKVGYSKSEPPVALDSITITSPNGKESWKRGTTHTVSWSYTGSLGSYVKITRLQGGIEVGTISASTSIGTGGKGSYSWAINPTGSTGSNCKVKIQSISQPSITDTSNNDFNLTPAGTTTPSITVTAPNGGETWQRGTTHTVTWDYTGSPGSYVKITRLQGGIEVGTISTSTSIGTGGKGSYSWAINPTGSTGSNCKVRIQSISQPSIYDTSNNDFNLTPAGTATPTISVTSPNGGQSFVMGSHPTITWTSSGAVGSYVKMELLKGTAIAQTLSSSTPNDGSYVSWTIPTNLTAGSDYKIRITSTTNPTITDTSNANFKIT